MGLHYYETATGVVTAHATVIPAQAGIHSSAHAVFVMDSRLRGNDGFNSICMSIKFHLDTCGQD